jgi:hypothetical protein
MWQQHSDRCIVGNDAQLWSATSQFLIFHLELLTS